MSNIEDTAQAIIDNFIRDDDLEMYSNEHMEDIIEPVSNEEVENISSTHTNRRCKFQKYG